MVIVLLLSCWWMPRVEAAACLKLTKAVQFQFAHSADKFIPTPSIVFPVPQVAGVRFSTDSRCDCPNPHPNS
jgi:hypothetical protein